MVSASQVRRQRLEVVHNHGAEQVGLVDEAGEHGAGRQAGCGGNVAHRRRLVTTLVEQAFGRVEQEATGALLGQRAAGQRPRVRFSRDDLASQSVR